MARLTKLEREMLRRSGEFVLAGEWPWEGPDTPKENRKEEREKAALISAVTKMEHA
ncbi:MAG: hypothetical protein Q8R02_23285 [Hyphomonadaceae bacterium]|nr:hypothetical protein [Hyphomonadaceae bacterium]